MNQSQHTGYRLRSLYWSFGRSAKQTRAPNCHLEKEVLVGECKSDRECLSRPDSLKVIRLVTWSGHLIEEISWLQWDSVFRQRCQCGPRCAEAKLNQMRQWNKCAQPLQSKLSNRACSESTLLDRKPQTFLCDFHSQFLSAFGHRLGSHRMYANSTN